MEIRQSAVQNLLKTGVQAKIVGNLISINDSYDVKTEIPEEKRQLLLHISKYNKRGNYRDKVAVCNKKKKNRS